MSLLALAVCTPARAGDNDPAVDGEILVRLSNSSALDPLLGKYGLSLVGRFGARPIFRLRVIGTGSVERTLGALSMEPGVLNATRNRVHSAPEARGNLAWAIGVETAYRAQWAPAALRLAEAHQLSTGEGIRVAVLDTGVDTGHPAFAKTTFLPGFDFVDGDNDPSEVGTRADLGFGHGTHVAGLIALAAPSAAIVPMRVLEPSGQGNAWVIAEAVLKAVDPDGNPATDDGAHVINLSLGTLDRTGIMDAIGKLASCSFFDPEVDPTDFADPGYNDDRERCRTGKGAVVVEAAGNGASESERQFPAAEGGYGLLAIAATAENGLIAPFSNFGSWIEVAAPGDGITSTVPGGGFGTWSGTSMAAPLAAGTAALVLAYRKDLTPKAAARVIEQSARPICGFSQRQIDAVDALNAVKQSGNGCKTN